MKEHEQDRIRLNQGRKGCGVEMATIVNKANYDTHLFFVNKIMEQRADTRRGNPSAVRSKALVQDQFFDRLKISQCFFSGNVLPAVFPDSGQFF